MDLATVEDVSSAAEFAKSPLATTTPMSPLADGHDEALETRYRFENLLPYVHPPETKDDMPWSELSVLDLEDFYQPGGKQRLAAQLSHAVHNVGFFCVKNLGVSQEQIDRQLTLAKAFFDLPTVEKAKNRANTEASDYHGYVESRHISSDKLHNHIEIYNIPKFIPENEGKHTSHPELIDVNRAEIEAFSKHVHEHIVIPLMVLFALVLELSDENLFAKQHSYDTFSDDYLRYMKYNKRTDEEHAASDFLQAKGHTDLGSVTLLFYQPVAGLQIQTAANQPWKYIQGIPGTATVNIGDTLSLLSNGFLKSTIHRVASPPRDQWAYDRFGLMYFTRPRNDLVLKPLVNISPVLQGLQTPSQESNASKPITMLEFVRAKQLAQLSYTSYKELSDKDGNFEVVPGVSHRFYA
ncbi:UPF0676 protein [Penicillium longicatenatum]|nr:UPF0676 protein [Penicillium longicatenatum]